MRCGAGQDSEGINMAQARDQHNAASFHSTAQLVGEDPTRFEDDEDEMGAEAADGTGAANGH